MDWLAIANARLRRGNQILFSRDSALLQPLTSLLSCANRRETALWAFELAQEGVRQWEERHPSERRPAEALLAARAWATGEIRMPIARQSILACHALAKELENRADIARCHAIAQACSVVHTPKHALGFPIYELTALVYALGIQACRNTVERRSAEYVEKLSRIRAHADEQNVCWADFMLR